jgi:hypothetical protein
MAGRPDEADHQVSEDRWVESVPVQPRDAFLVERRDDSDTARTGLDAREIFAPLAARPLVLAHPWGLSVNPRDLLLPAAVRAILLVLESSLPELLPASQLSDVWPSGVARKALPQDAREHRSEMRLRALSVVREPQR